MLAETEELAVDDEEELVELPELLVAR